MRTKPINRKFTTKNPEQLSKLCRSIISGKYKVVLCDYELDALASNPHIPIEDFKSLLKWSSADGYIHCLSHDEKIINNCPKDKEVWKILEEALGAYSFHHVLEHKDCPKSVIFGYCRRGLGLVSYDGIRVIVENKNTPTSALIMLSKRPWWEGRMGKRWGMWADLHGKLLNHPNFPEGLRMQILLEQ